MTRWLFHPFRYIAGGKALLAGGAVMLLTAVLACTNRAHLDGVLDLHLGALLPAVWYFLEPLIDWGVATLLFYAAGLLFAPSRPRLIDIAGTFALSRAPMLPAVLLGFLQPAGMPPDPLAPATLVLAFGLLLCVAWMVTLLYNAFTVSTNLRGTRAALVFAGTLLLAEIASKLLLAALYPAF